MRNAGMIWIKICIPMRFNGNLVLLATIGLISVLREGVEVIIFYMGMIGELATKDFIT